MRVHIYCGHYAQPPSYASSDVYGKECEYEDFRDVDDDDWECGYSIRCPKCGNELSKDYDIFPAEVI